MRNKYSERQNNHLTAIKIHIINKIITRIVSCGKRKIKLIKKSAYPHTVNEFIGNTRKETRRERRKGEAYKIK